MWEIRINPLEEQSVLITYPAPKHLSHAVIRLLFREYNTDCFTVLRKKKFSMNLCLEIENKMIVRINQAGYGNTCLSSTREENKGKQSALHIASSRLAGIKRETTSQRQTNM